MKQRLSTIASLISLTIVAITAVLVTGQQFNTSAEPEPQRTEVSTKYRLSGPYTHKNLTIFLVHGAGLAKTKSFLTLQEALAQKKVIVYETKDVNELAIRNLSNQDVYVQSGDIVRGGDQDRMISVDFIVPPKSGRIPIAAFCVESGRWSRRGNEVSGSFSSSDNSVSAKEIKLAAKQANSQDEVWKGVQATQDKLSNNVGSRVNSPVSESSFVLAVENEKVKESAAEYVQALSGVIRRHKDVIGYVFAINGQVNSADVYSSSALFIKLWPKLLKASAVEALAELDGQNKSETLNSDAALSFLRAAEDARPSEREVTQRVKLLTREDATSVFFETRDSAQKDAWIHRNYIRK